MQKIFLLLFIAILTTPIFAEDSEEYTTFFGFGYGQAKQSFKRENLEDFGSLKVVDDFQDELVFRFGIQSETGRLYTTFRYNNQDMFQKENIESTTNLNTNHYTTVLNLEAFSESIYFNELPLYFAYGAQFGATYIENDAHVRTKTQNIDVTSTETSFVYGIQGSSILELTKHLNIDMGVGILWNSQKELKYNKNLFITLNYIL